MTEDGAGGLGDDLWNVLRNVVRNRSVKSFHDLRSLALLDRLSVPELAGSEHLPRIRRRLAVVRLRQRENDEGVLRPDGGGYAEDARFRQALERTADQEARASADRERT